MHSNVSKPNSSTVLYYSNNILAKSFPDLGPYISLGVTVVNVLMTFPPIILIEVSRRLAYFDGKLTPFVPQANGPKATVGNFDCRRCGVLVRRWIRSQPRPRYLVKYSNIDICHVSYPE